MSFWLAVVTEENCKALAERRYPLFALQHRVGVVAGDRCILYRSGKNRGFVGEFEFVAEPDEAPVRIGARTFAFSMRWKPVSLRDDDPVQIGPILHALDFIKNKQPYGMALRAAFRRLGEADYGRLSKLLRRGHAERSARQQVGSTS